MAKNRHKKKKNGSGPKDMELTSDDYSVRNFSEAMDTSEVVASKQNVTGPLRKTKKGRPMKRSKNARKMQAVAKAISQIDKSEVKILKTESKTLRIGSAKKLYD